MLSSFLEIIVPCLVQVRFSCQEQLEEVKLSFPLRIPGSLGIRGIGDAMVLLTSVGWLIGLVTKDPWLVAWSEPKEYFTHLGILTRSWPPWEVWGKFTVLQKNFRIQYQEVILSVEQSSA